MNITVTSEIQRLLPSGVRRKAGFKVGDQLEVNASGGVVTLTPKLPAADDEYTAGERRQLNDRLAEGLADVKAGRIYGPFHTADEMIAHVKSEVRKKAAAKKKPKRVR